ncbi:MAG: hypothetical protein LV481_11735 [Methylacidiphilales bacterium]|nr:hypothetical protein [Candidatus Methylacidiphilales bacterium]
MKQYFIWGVTILFFLALLLFRARPSEFVPKDDPLHDAARAMDRLQEEIGFIQEQAELDTRQKTIEALRDLYDDLSLLKKYPELAADRQRLIQQVDAYQASLKHPPDYLVRWALLTHDFEWTDGKSFAERMTFEDSGSIQGSAFFKDANWDVISGFLFINHKGWAMRLWYDPKDIRFEGQLIRNNRLRDSSPGGWIWDPSIPYSVVEITLVN